MLSLSCIGIGFVWGWLAGKLEGGSYSTLRVLLALVGSSLGFCLLVFRNASWSGVAFFLGAALFTFLLHAAFRAELRKRISMGHAKKLEG